MIHIYLLQVLEMERALLCFNSHHIHRGICIEGTSTHLNCLYDQRKAVLSSRKWEKKTDSRRYG